MSGTFLFPEFAMCFSVIRPSVFANCCSSEVRLLLSLRGWEILSPFMITFQKGGSQVFEKDTPAIKLRVFLKGVCIFQRSKEFIMTSFLEQML